MEYSVVADAYYRIVTPNGRMGTEKAPYYDTICAVNRQCKCSSVAFRGNGGECGTRYRPRPRSKESGRGVTFPFDPMYHSNILFLAD